MSLITIPFGIDVKTKSIWFYKEVNKGQDVVCFVCDEPLIKCKGTKNREFLKHVNCIKEGSPCYVDDKQTSKKVSHSLDMAYYLFGLFKEENVIMRFEATCMNCNCMFKNVKFNTNDIININKTDKYEFAVSLTDHTFVVSIDNNTGTADYNVDSYQLRKHLKDNNTMTNNDMKKQLREFAFTDDKENSYCSNCEEPTQFYKALEDTSILDMYYKTAKRGDIKIPYHFLAKGWIPSVNERLKQDGLKYAPSLKTWYCYEGDVPFKNLVRSYGKPVKFVKECLKCNVKSGNTIYIKSQLCKCEK